MVVGWGVAAAACEGVAGVAEAAAACKASTLHCSEVAEPLVPLCLWHQYCKGRIS